jgi:hypothetical protein
MRETGHAMTDEKASTNSRAQAGFSSGMTDRRRRAGGGGAFCFLWFVLCTKSDPTSPDKRRLEIWGTQICGEWQIESRGNGNGSLGFVCATSPDRVRR